jgi:hypothetical protein
MGTGIEGWFLGSQRVMQRLAAALIVGLAVAAFGWTAGALGGWLPWLTLQVGLGEAGVVDAGMAVQATLTALLVGLCFFLPANARMMRLEQSHRDFRVSMRDVARAYQAVHAADRDDAFELKSEFDSVRDRIIWLRSHAGLGDLEPEILELAAQMSHESRDLAELWSTERIERARNFLRERQEEAQRFQDRVEHAHASCREIRRWLDGVEVEEAAARARGAELASELADLMPRLGLELAERPLPVHHLGVAAE